MNQFQNSWLLKSFLEEAPALAYTNTKVTACCMPGILNSLEFPIWKQLPAPVTLLTFGSFVHEINHVLSEVSVTFFSLGMFLHEVNCLLLHYNQLDALISQIYFWNKTLLVSDSSSVHHQEFFTVHTAIICVIQDVQDQDVPSWSCSQAVSKTCMTYTFAVCTVKNSWWWTEELSETCRVFLIFWWPCISIYLFLNINQLVALNIIISLFQASTCFEHMCSSSGGQNCIIQSLVSSHL